MKKLLLLILLAVPAFGSQKYSYKDPQLDSEWQNNYKEHKYPNWINARGSSATVTYVTASTITLPVLSVSLPMQIDANHNLTSAAINLSGAQVTGSLPINKIAWSSFPAFSATGDTTGILNSTLTKCTFTTEEYDTNSNYASSRFTPTVAGYYQINAAIFYASVTTGRFLVTIYKTGAEFKRGQDLNPGANQIGITVSALVFLNGSTDYVEIFTFQTSGVTQAISTNGGLTAYFQGALLIPT